MYNSEKISDIKRILGNDESLFECFNDLYLHVEEKYHDLYVICNTNYMTINSSKKGNIYAFQRTDKDKLFLSLNKRKFIFKAIDIDKYKANFDEQFSNIVNNPLIFSNDMIRLQNNIIISYRGYKLRKEQAVEIILKSEDTFRKFYDSVIIHYSQLVSKHLETKELEIFKASVIANRNVKLETDGFMNSNFQILNKAKDKMRGHYSCDLLLRLKAVHLIPFLAYVMTTNFRFYKLVVEQYILFEDKFDEILKLISSINEMYYSKKRIVVEE